MYQLVPLDSCKCFKKISIKINVATDEGKAEMKSDTEQTTKSEQLYKAGSEWKLNSGPDSSVGYYYYFHYYYYYFLLA